MSPPPPNQPRVVTSMRVLKCTAGTRGLAMCATSETPEAQKRGSSAAPGMLPRNSSLNSPETVETFTPTFSNTRPRITLITPPPPGLPSGFASRAHGVRTKRASEPASASIASKAAQTRSRRDSNQARAAGRSAACGGPPADSPTAGGAGADGAAEGGREASDMA